MIDFDFSMFFDREAVTKAVSKATRGVLSKAGAYVRTAARSSIRTRKAISAPGDPPSSHTGTLKRSILFGYDRSSESVVIGPTNFRAADGATGGASRLELGGTTSRGGKVRHYAARPFMLPALEKEASKFPALWRDQVKG